MAVRPFRFALTAAVALTVSAAVAEPAAAAAAGRPTITKVAPATGPTSGGTRVRLVGTNFTNVKSVTFGGTSAQVFAMSGTGQSMTVTAPQNSAQNSAQISVDVTVTTASGTATKADAFTYTAPWNASWQSPETIAAPVDSPRVMSCPTSHCYGMDSYGNFVDSGSGAGSWINHSSPSGDDAVQAQNACDSHYPDYSCASLSCPQVGFCATVDDQGRPLVWNGATWQSYPSLNPAGASSFDHTPLVSCASDTFCMVQDSGGDFSTFDGTAWSPVKTLGGTLVTTSAQVHDRVNGSTDDAVSCAGDECMTVTEDDAYHYVAGAWTGGGDQQWAVRDGEVGPDANKVSCANVAQTGTQLLCATSAIDSTMVFSGGQWGGIDYKRPSDFVSCRSDGHCVAMSQAGATYVYGDKNVSVDKWGWSSSYNLPTADRLGTPYTIACGAAATCRLGIGNGYSATFNPTTHTWSAATSILAADTGISALGCTITPGSSRYCLAGTRGPDLVVDGGSGWSAPTETFARGERTAAVSCVDNTSFCLAITDTDGFAGKTNHYAVYRNGALTTHSMLTGSYHALSCWSSSGCYAVSNTRVLRWNGSVWSVAINLAARHLSVTGIACPVGDQACLAVTHDGHALWVNGTRTSAPVSMHRKNKYMHPVGVACRSIHACIAITNQATRFDPASEIFSDTGMDWLPQGVLSTNRLSQYAPEGVSCAPSTTLARCFAVGPDDSSAYDGAIHHVPAPDDNPTFQIVPKSTSVTCPSTTACYVGDDDGQVRAYS